MSIMTGSDRAIQNNSITSLQSFAVGTMVQHIDLSDNSMPELVSWHMPSSLQYFRCQNCGIRKIAGVVFPATMSLKTLDLTGSNVETFEVANSSVSVLEAVHDLVVATTESKCSDSHARARVSRTMHLCVLLDDDFSAKYLTGGLNFSDTLSHMNSTAGEGSGVSTGVKSGMSDWMTAVMIACRVMIVLIVSGLICIIFRRQKNVWDKKHSEAEHVEVKPHAVPSCKATQYVSNFVMGMSRTSRTSTTPEGMQTDSTTSFIIDDIRKDNGILQYRLLQEEVVRGKLIAKGGYGAVYLATFQNEKVVVKQLLLDRVYNKHWLKSFMGEIRLCSTLNHPKIVRFIGVTWSSLLDLSMVMEYMPNGDLHAMLQTQLQRETRDKRARNGYTWFHSAGEDGPSKCKSLIALDIVEALVYLHSFEIPIIHRDLKPKNVLLSDSWEARLTDFGTSREVDLDQTMTAEIGTISWVAPEVLRGEHYCEKADVYSFGVILTELDTCRRPYSQGITRESSHDCNSKPSTTRIALLASTGVLRPEVHEDCPSSMRNLVNKCLAYNPNDRPSAVQLHYELRNLEFNKDDC